MGTTVAGQYVASPATLTNDQRKNLRLTAKGALAVALESAAGVALGAGEYETVAAGQTAQALGATGAAGDYLEKCIFQPANTACGTTTVLDGTTVIYTYTAGTLSDLKPWTVEFNAVATAAGWKVTTGTSIAVLAVGNFT